MKRSNVNRTVAALAVVGVLLTGCSGGGDDDASEAPRADDRSNDQGGIFDTGESDGETEFAGDDEAEFAEEPSEPASESTSESTSESVRDDSGERGDAPTADTGSEEAAVEPAPTSGDTIGADSTDAEGGLFGAEEPADVDTDRTQGNTFEDYGYRDFVAAADDPLSTFALDVDTGSYSIARQWLDEGTLPPRESVRPEEYVNAFDYDYDAPREGLELTVDGGPSPFDHDNILVRIGVQGEIVDDRDRAPAALTFVIDTSGSMDRDDRLGLVKDSLAVLVDELDADDTVAIVT